MSVSAGTLSSTVAGQITSTLLPTVTRIDAHEDSSPLSIVLAFTIVFILAPVIISSNAMILAAFYRYKRLRTASNCLLASLAVSDFGVGVFMPFGVHLELNGVPETGVTSICIAPYCIVIALCSVSVLVTVAIAVDRLTSLAQPLRYKNIITHSSVEKYIAVFWIYAIAVGLSPLVYAQIMGFNHQAASANCRFGAAVQPPVRVFLVVAVWAPSALVLLGCYIYVYLVARAHARAIYTVELSFRHQTQTMALPRYGQTLAVTVGAFLILWLPFQACMLLDIFCGTTTLTEWSIVWLALPILAHSSVNPWIYAFHHGEMRVAAGKIAEDVVTLFGIHPSRYGCSPVGRGGGSNLELAEVNKSNNEERRPPVEDYFAAKHHNHYCTRERRPDIISNDTDISPEGNDTRQAFSHYESTADIVEDNVHDLAKMLGPEYAIDRCHVIDSNHNVDKIKNLKYLLDPTFNKIRYLRRFNQKYEVHCSRDGDDGDGERYNEPKFTSYQNLTGRKCLQINALSDPMLNAEIPCTDSTDLCEAIHKEILRLRQRRDSGLASMSDPNIKAIQMMAKSPSPRNIPEECHGYSALSLDHSRYQQIRKHDRRTCREGNSTKARGDIAAKWRQASKQLTVTANKLSSFFHPERQINYRDSRVCNVKSTLSVTLKNFDSLRHSESIAAIEGTSTRLLEPTRFMNSLTVPIIHSEPPSPVDPRPLDSLHEEEVVEVEPEIRFSRRSSSKSPIRHSDPVPFVLLNIEDFDQKSSFNDAVDPVKLAEALAQSTEKSTDSGTFTENLFPEHNSTRFSSRRPSDLRWSEASRSQEILSNVNHQKSPSSYSVNNYHHQACNSSSDLNVTCLDSFMCPDAISSSLRDSFYEAPSIPDSDIFTSFDETEVNKESNKFYLPSDGVQSSVSSVYIDDRNERLQNEQQSKPSDSVILRCRHAILRLQADDAADDDNDGDIASDKNRVFSPMWKSKRAPLATPTPIDICTPTFEPTVDIKGAPGIGVRV